MFVVFILRPTIWLVQRSWFKIVGSAARAWLASYVERLQLSQLAMGGVRRLARQTHPARVQRLPQGCVLSGVPSGSGSLLATCVLASNYLIGLGTG